MQYITVTRVCDDMPVYLNIAHIVAVGTFAGGELQGKTFINTVHDGTTGGSWKVKESVEEVMRMIEQASIPTYNIINGGGSWE